MVVKLVGRENLQQLLDWLESHWPASMKMYLELKWSLDGRFTEMEVFVDKWPNPDVAACIVDQVNSQLQSKAYYANSIMGMYGVTKSAVQEFLNNCHFLDWNKDMLLDAVADCVWQVGRTLSNNVVEYPCVLLRATPQDLQPLPIPDGMKLSPITENVIDIVNSTWKQSDGGSRPYVHDLVRLYPSVMMTTAAGEHVGHMLMYNGGIPGMLYVFPQFRGKSYAKIIITHLAQKLFDMGEDAYVFVEVDNLASMNLHTSVGFKVVEGLQNFGWLTVKPSVKDKQ